MRCKRASDTLNEDLKKAQTNQSAVKVAVAEATVIRSKEVAAFAKEPGDVISVAPLYVIYNLDGLGLEFQFEHGSNWSAGAQPRLAFVVL